MCFLVFTILLPMQTASHFSAFKPCPIPNYMRVIPEPPPGGAVSVIKALMGGLLLFSFFFPPGRFSPPLPPARLQLYCMPSGLPGVAMRTNSPRQKRGFDARVLP